MTTVDLAEAAELVGVSPRTVHKWVERGFLAPVRPGAKPSRFRISDVTECAYQRMPRTERERLDRLAERWGGA